MAVSSSHYATTNMLRTIGEILDTERLGEAKTKGFDFSQEDRVDPDKFNRVIWEDLMGGKPYPSAPHSKPKNGTESGTK